MLFDISGIRLHVIGQTVALAIEHGREWGQLFLNDLSWRGNKAKMTKHAISESALFALRNNVNSEFYSDLFSQAGVPSEITALLYSHVKLTSTLFTIYGIDTIRATAHPLVLAAASGVSISELATQLETSDAPFAIQKALQSVPRSKFVEINKILGARLIAKVKEQESANDTTMSTCGNSVKAFITAYCSA